MNMKEFFKTIRRGNLEQWAVVIIVSSIFIFFVIEVLLSNYSVTYTKIGAETAIETNAGQQ